MEKRSASKKKHLPNEFEDVKCELVDPYALIDEASICSPDNHGRKKNCQDNPWCVYGFGPSIWDDDRYFECLGKDYAKLKRHFSGNAWSFPVGLRNLGATCYLNVLMQSLFHNLLIREAVYMMQHERSNGIDEHVNKIITSLQVAFGHMDLCTNGVYSLESFTEQQQDPQEFSKLFLARIESLNPKHSISPSSSPGQSLGNLITGMEVNSTQCSGCKHSSKHTVPFHEIEVNIEGHKHLQDAINQLRVPEILNGDNKYHCPRCADYQEASRQCDIDVAPTILFVQLLRYVYDRSSNGKKKLKDKICFPAILKIKDENFKLVAVLYHLGQSASGGHYVCDVLEWATGQWWHCNDDQVSRTADPVVSPMRSSDADHDITSTSKGPMRATEDRDTDAMEMGSASGGGAGDKVKSSCCDRDEEWHDTEDTNNNLPSKRKRQSSNPSNTSSSDGGGGTSTKPFSDAPSVITIDDVGEDGGPWGEGRSSGGSNGGPRARMSDEVEIVFPSHSGAWEDKEQEVWQTNGPESSNGDGRGKKRSKGVKADKAHSDSSKPRPRSKVASDTHASSSYGTTRLDRARDVYMLVYVKCDKFEAALKGARVEPSDHIKEEVANSSSIFDEEVAQYERKKLDLRNEVNMRRGLVESMASTLAPKGKGDEFRIVPSHWLRQWITGVKSDEPPEPKAPKEDKDGVIDLCDPGFSTTSSSSSSSSSSVVEGSEGHLSVLFKEPMRLGPAETGFMCSHGKLNMSSIKKCKVVSVEAFETMQGSLSQPPDQEFQLNQGNYRCEDCYEQFHDKQQRMEKEVQRTEKLVKSLEEDQELADDHAGGFYVQKKWITAFTKNVSALKKELERITGHTNGASSSTNAKTIDKFFTQSEADKGAASDVNSTSFLKFDVTVNRDLMCDHGGCVPSFKRSVKVVRRKSWLHIKELCRGKEFEIPSDGGMVCVLCAENLQAENQQAQAERDTRAAEASGDKALAALFSRKKSTPTEFDEAGKMLSALDWTTEGTNYYLIDATWLRMWRAYLSDIKRPPPEPLQNTGLLCTQHNRLLLSPAMLLKFPSDDFPHKVAAFKVEALEACSAQFLDVELVSEDQWRKLIAKYSSVVTKGNTARNGSGSLGAKKILSPIGAPSSCSSSSPALLLLKSPLRDARDEEDHDSDKTEAQYVDIADGEHEVQSSDHRHTSPLRSPSGASPWRSPAGILPSRSPSGTLPLSPLGAFTSRSPSGNQVSVPIEDIDGASTDDEPALVTEPDVAAACGLVEVSCAFSARASAWQWSVPLCFSCIEDEIDSIDIQRSHFENCTVKVQLLGENDLPNSQVTIGDHADRGDRDQAVSYDVPKRSTRSRSKKNKQLHDLIVSSSDAIKTVKLKIYQDLFDEATPARQSLYFNGEELVVLTKSLGEYHVKAGSTLELKIREGDEGGDGDFDGWGDFLDVKSETGFAGTFLQGGAPRPPPASPSVEVMFDWEEHSTRDVSIEPVNKKTKIALDSENDIKMELMGMGFPADLAHKAAMKYSDVNAAVSYLLGM